MAERIEEHFEGMLRGWKDIEHFLGLTRKTIQAKGYPVRKNGGVYALRPELEAHLARLLGMRPQASRKFPQTPNNY